MHQVFTEAFLDEFEKLSLDRNQVSGALLGGLVGSGIMASTAQLAFSDPLLTGHAALSGATLGATMGTLFTKKPKDKTVIFPGV